MGGNALKHLGVGRKSAAEYRLITDYLDGLLPGRHALIASYRQKETFGDADFLIDRAGLDVTQVGDKPRWFAQLLMQVDSKGYYLNSPVYGFEFDGLQIDLITTSTFDCSLAYYGYNDLGDLVNRVADAMGFKYGHGGLRYVVLVDGTNAIETITLSTDTPAILDFLGYEPHGDFETLESIWAYAASSKYFDPAIDQLENLSSADRSRAVKRPTYTGFLKYVEGMPATYDWSDKLKLREHHLLRAFEVFPGFGKAYLAAHQAQELRKRRAAWFNGEKVQRLTGLTGKSLGEFMRQFRAKYPDPLEVPFIEQVILNERTHFIEH